MLESFILAPIFFFFSFTYTSSYIYSYMISGPMQFKGNLINQTSENGKKSNFWSDFGPFGRNLDNQKFFLGFYLH